VRDTLSLMPRLSQREFRRLVPAVIAPLNRKVDIDGEPCDGE
jgi:hypothetical protein